MSAAVLAEVWRGTVLEAVIRGHVAAVDASGALLARAGDPEAITTLRSAVKPLQALPFLSTRAADRLGCDEEEVAIACGSHVGEPDHLAVVRRLLGRAGLDESALRCPAHPPYSEAAWRSLVMAGEAPRPVHNNCSGKHAAMLATCVVSGWPVDSYVEPDHPLQRTVREVLAEHAGTSLDAAPWGIDGCGLPTYGLALRALARAFATAAAAGGGFARCQAAMAAHPHLVAGDGRFDTVLLAGHGATITAKSGGAAVWAATTRPGRVAVAVKLESGAAEHLPPVALAVLAASDLLPAGTLPAAYERPPLLARDGRAVGETRAVLRLEAA